MDRVDTGNANATTIIGPCLNYSGDKAHGVLKMVMLATPELLTEIMVQLRKIDNIYRKATTTIAWKGRQAQDGDATKTITFHCGSKVSTCNLHLQSSKTVGGTHFVNTSDFLIHLSKDNQHSNS